MASVYQINKGVNKPIVFRGLKAQYIAYLAVGLVFLLVSFAVLYISGVSLFVVLPLILILGTVLFISTFRLSHRFGQFGLMKFFAKKGLPRALKFRSRRLFTALKWSGSESQRTDKNIKKITKNYGGRDVRS